MAKKSRAVSSQGTHFYIQVLGTNGTPLTITDISNAEMAVVTATNTLKVGDVVEFAGVTGMTEINGLAGVVSVASGTEFTIKDINSTDFTAYTSGGTATPFTFIESCQHKTYNFDDPGASDIDITTLCSDEKEFGVGLPDPGNFTANMNYVEDDAAQIEIQKGRSDGVLRYFRIHKRNKWIKVFTASVKSFTDAGAVDGTNTSDLALRISGPKVEVLGA